MAFPMSKPDVPGLQKLSGGSIISELVTKGLKDSNFSRLENVLPKGGRKNNQQKKDQQKKKDQQQKKQNGGSLASAAVGNNVTNNSFGAMEHVLPVHSGGGGNNMLNEFNNVKSMSGMSRELHVPLTGVDTSKFTVYGGKRKSPALKHKRKSPSKSKARARKSPK